MLIDKTKTIAYECVKFLSGTYFRDGKLVSKEQCQACYAYQMNTKVGGKFAKRAACVAENAKKHIVDKEASCEG